MSPLTWPELFVEPRHAIQMIGMDIIVAGGGRANLLCFFLNGSGFEKWEELVMDHKYETKLVLHLATSTSRARMQKSSHPSA